MAFDDETIDVLIGGYMSKDAAQEDYEAVLASGGYLHGAVVVSNCLLYTSPSPRDGLLSRMPSSA